MTFDPQFVYAVCIFSITGVNNGVAVVMQQEAVPGVSEMLPTLPVAMPTMSVTMVTATTNAIADVISSPAVLTQGQHQYPNVEGKYGNKLQGKSLY